MIISTTLTDEKELLMKAAKGDETAFSGLFYMYHQKILTFIFRLIKSYEIAEDIVQDVFVKVWERKEDLAAIERFDAYMYVLARNHAFNTLKKMAYDRAKKQEAAGNIKTLYPVNEQTETFSDYYTLLDQAVDELPPQQQKVYILSRHKRLKYNEIAQQMQLSNETVKKYLKLATRFITSYLRTNTGK